MQRVKYIKLLIMVKHGFNKLLEYLAIFIPFPFLIPIQGAAVGAYGTYIVTTNGGTTWIDKSNSTLVNQDINSISFKNSSTGWGAGKDGTIIRITGIDTWTLQIKGTRESIYSAAFADENSGLAIGSSGTIIKNK